MAERAIDQVRLCFTTCHKYGTLLSQNLINKKMNWITKILRRKEIKQCAILGVSIRFSRRQYDKRRIPKLYFTKDYTIKNSVLYIKGDEYSPYMWNYERMIGLIKDGVLSENVC